MLQVTSNGKETNKKQEVRGTRSEKNNVAGELPFAEHEVRSKKKKQCSGQPARRRCVAGITSRRTEGQDKRNKG